MVKIRCMEEQEERQSPHPPADPRVNRLERATRRLGSEVFGDDGLLGRLEDYVIDAESLNITGFVVGEPARRVPYGELRHMAEEGDHTVLDLDRSGLEAMPLHHL